MLSTPCDLCGADDWFIRFPNTDPAAGHPDVSVFRCTHDGYGSHSQIVQCHQCDHVYSNPRWEEAELLEAYEAVVDDTYVAERAGRVKTFSKHLERMESFTGAAGGRQLLDVGAYIGVFVELALAKGWDALGVEPSTWAVEAAQSSGLPVIEGTLEVDKLRGKQFDVITLWDVIEHVSSPSAELEMIYKLLKPGGMVVIHTMDIDSITARLMGKRWPWLMDMHIHYFSRKTMAKLLKKQGFDVIWIGAQGRYLSLGYIASRVSGVSKPLGRILGGGISRLGLSKATMPVNFGDLFTAFAYKPDL